MPYIRENTRDRAIINPRTPGELNYVITKILVDYIKRNGVRYAILNEVIGVLECAKLEMYRRLVAPYEDEQKVTHGDVY